MANQLLTLFALVCSFAANAQFYPSANGVWCGVDDSGGPPGFNVQFQMGAFPDTVINSTSYKKISEYNSSSGDFEIIREYYVRSDTNGRGYVYLLDSMAEFLTGDVSTQAGDTVHNVLFALSGANDVTYLILDMVVDSVVILSNAGVTVTRHYLNPSFFNPLSADVVFWQMGMGTSFGPVLEGSGYFSLCGVNDSIQYDLANNGLPGPGGVGQICWPIATGMDESTGKERPLVSPNPSTGHFMIGDTRVAHAISVYNPTGKLVWQDSGNRIDLARSRLASTRQWWFRAEAARRYG